MIDDPFYEVEDLPPVSLPPASSVRPILIIDSPEIPIVEGADSPCNTPTSTRSNRFSRRSEKGKKVSFTADTVIPKDNNIALSITRHAYTKELGYTKYTIEVSEQECSSVVFSSVFLLFIFAIYRGYLFLFFSLPPSSLLFFSSPICVRFF